jgi:hypothetical protein
MGEDDAERAARRGSQRPGDQRAVDTAAHKLAPLPVPAHRGESLAVRVPEPCQHQLSGGGGRKSLQTKSLEDSQVLGRFHIWFGSLYPFKSTVHYLTRK